MSPPAPPVPPSPPPPPPPPGAARPARVAAILVVHNGAEWVGAAIRGLRNQDYPDLAIVAVDNASTDGSGRLLAERLPAASIVRLDDNVGFGRAVAAARRDPACPDADFVLLVHDDLVLAPDAVRRLVEALEADPTLGIVGPKLREWSDEPVLAEVGMTTDRFGRPERGFDAGELDQGQRDGQRDVLYVNSAGMLLRRSTLRAVGGFDARYPAFRDDLDLCWRAWLAGARVGVVPLAVGYHLSASALGSRQPYRAHPVEIRYLVERHTLATLMKNYGPLRLAWVLPIGTLLAALKVAGFLVARRFAEAWALLRALGWNAANLGHTLRRRRLVQRRRRVGDGALAVLFAPGIPRFKTYREAAAEWLAGGGTRALVDVAAEPATGPAIDPLAGRPMVRFLRDRPAAVVGVLLAGAFLAGILPLLGDGPLVGGQVAPWPDNPLRFLSAYASPWGVGPLASGALPSPAQPLLGLVSLLGFGSQWLAQRLAVLGLLPLAWLLTLRAGRLVTGRQWPRALGATVYVLSPVLVGALAEGRYGVAVVGTLLPGVVLLIFRAGDPRTPPGSAWRAAALLALVLATSVAAAPVAGLLPASALAVAILVTLFRRAAGTGPALLRLLAAAVGAGAVLAPWLYALVTTVRLDFAAESTDLPLWRALLLLPDTADAGGAHATGAGGLLLAFVTGAVLLAALLVGLRARPRLVASLMLLIAVAGLGAWALARLQIGVVWAPAALLPGVVGLAVLTMVVARWFTDALRSYDFGLRQIGILVAGGGLAAGLLGSATLFATGPWTSLRLDPELVPAFVGAEGDLVGPYRVLVLDTDCAAVDCPDPVVRWGVTGATGPSMLEFGTIDSPALTARLDRAVRRTAAGGDATAGADLGRLNVRYVVLQRPVPALIAALSRQPALEPQESTAAPVYRVRSWLPRAAVLAESVGEQLLATGDPGITDGIEAGAFRQVGPGEYQGGSGGARSGLLVLTEAAADAWQATDGGRQLQPVAIDGINAFRVPDDGRAPRLAVQATGTFARRLVLAGQVLAVLVLLSLAVRPPGFTGRQMRRELRAAPAAPPADADVPAAGNNGPVQAGRP